VKFLADENFPIDSVITLRKAGLEVDSVQELSPSLDDISILESAVASKTILLTFDRDFSDLIFNHQMAAPHGIVYFRFNPLNSEEPARILLDLIPEIKIEGNITVVTRSNVRQRRLPNQNTE
jgi:predicted nuclease of predicted toxin-antitoxin system